MLLVHNMQEIFSNRNTLRVKKDVTQKQNFLEQNII